MSELAVVDCHGHVFPPLAGPSGFPTAEAHLVHQQRAMHVHGNQPYRRRRDGAVVTERPLWQVDDPSEAVRRLEVDMVFWFPMRVPFANWMLSRIFLTYTGVKEAMTSTVNPITPAGGPGRWEKGPGSPPFDERIRGEWRTRAWDSTTPETVFPVRVSYALRMMTPYRRVHRERGCPGGIR